MNRLCIIILLGVAATSGCDSKGVPASVSTAPLYKVVVPADLPSTWTFGNNDGTTTTVNDRKSYMAWHRSGWDAYLFEMRYGSGELPFPQCTGYELVAYMDGYDQCNRAHRAP